MSLNYHNLKKHPKNFRDVTGLMIEECEKVVEKVRPEREKIEKQKMEECPICRSWKTKYCA